MQRAPWSGGVGGVASGWQAYARILVGADLAALYWAGAQQARISSAILQELVTRQADGVNNLGEVKGQIPYATRLLRMRCDYQKLP